MTKNIDQSSFGAGSAAVLPAEQVKTRLGAILKPAVPRSKRAFDLLVAVSGLLILSPVFVLLAGLILLMDGAPVFYAHERVGLGGRRFLCIKFRTMTTRGDAILAGLLARDPAARREWETNRKLSHDPRVTRLGALLRRTSLDELPQLWNVVKGDMSIVGPRPVVSDELAHYGVHAVEYLSVLPGVTGAWQVAGRSNTTYAERVALDVAYVHNQSLRGDIGIVLQTCRVVLSRDGAR
ncbi:MAG: sugar transferase [Rhodobacteraceae bacterium]|nr:sugar transferase [Paracoccaceae bacterium]